MKALLGASFHAQGGVSSPRAPLLLFVQSGYFGKRFR
jgi:hypothetical protein